MPYPDKYLRFLEEKLMANEKRKANIERAKTYLRKMEEIADKGGPNFKYAISDTLIKIIHDTLSSKGLEKNRRTAKLFYWKLRINSLLNRGFAKHPSEIGVVKIGEDIRDMFRNLTSGDLYETCKNFHKVGKQRDVQIGKKGSKTNVFEIAEITYETLKGTPKKEIFILINPKFLEEHFSEHYPKALKELQIKPQNREIKR